MPEIPEQQFVPCGENVMTKCDIDTCYCRMRIQRDELRAALMELVEHENGPCRLDHHGDCQNHGSFGEGECHIRRHRRLLGLELNDG